MSIHPASKLITIVIPVFNEAPVLPALKARLSGVMTANPDYDWRVVFVDDGSRDGSADFLLRWEIESNGRIRLVRLSRNFGHQPALTAGIYEAGDCDAMITMDADLQDPPELIPSLLDSWKNGADVVLAVRRSREDRGIRRAGFDAFHRIFALISDFKLRQNTGTFGLLGRPAIKAFKSLGERHRFFPGLRAWVGFTQAEVMYDRKERAAGTPAQTFRRLVRYAMDGVFSFSHMPLRLVSYSGVTVAGIGFATGMFFVARRLLGQEIAFTGFTTLVSLVLFLGGVQLIGIGILGEYLGRIYDEVKHRPLYVLRRSSQEIAMDK